ncbi:fumarate hydratase C-terminal domain-containing protein [Fusobacterium necrophorum]|uniref:fumarate hydratase C-terminal domain-containing protein n=1 Tax=Fusobacterium necrophorum TaxID=859 RepID=UPI0021BEE1BA|nr:fumarate hydratase C-terminal domain-containing protein [Fusobacterium necrophorum]
MFHAGPIVKTIDEANNKFKMISIGPTTSMRMEKFEKKFIKETGVKIIFKQSFYHFIN